MNRSHMAMGSDDLPDRWDTGRAQAEQGFAGIPFGLAAMHQAGRFPDNCVLFTAVHVGRNFGNMVTRGTGIAMQVVLQSAKAPALSTWYMSMYIRHKTLNAFMFLLTCMHSLQLRHGKIVAAGRHSG
eukprot:COSAG02_NODE_1_length_108762_cov_456.708287_23_plen_127_part_00